jgi:hypothetical protein
MGQAIEVLIFRIRWPAEASSRVSRVRRFWAIGRTALQHVYNGMPKRHPLARKHSGNWALLPVLPRLKSLPVHPALLFEAPSFPKQ